MDTYNNLTCQTFADGLIRLHLFVLHFMGYILFPKSDVINAIRHTSFMQYSNYYPNSNYCSVRMLLYYIERISMV